MRTLHYQQGNWDHYLMFFYLIKIVHGLWKTEQSHQSQYQHKVISVQKSLSCHSITYTWQEMEANISLPWTHSYRSLSVGWSPALSACFHHIDYQPFHIVMVMVASGCATNLLALWSVLFLTQWVPFSRNLLNISLPSSCLHLSHSHLFPKKLSKHFIPYIPLCPMCYPYSL